MSLNEASAVKIDGYLLHYEGPPGSVVERLRARIKTLKGHGGDLRSSQVTALAEIVGALEERVAALEPTP
jgi:hypothetical protein